MDGQEYEELSEPQTIVETGKKRGRRLLRPNDPLNIKSELKDKFWLRKFRSFFKKHYSEIDAVLSAEEKEFWEEFLSASGVPSRRGIYKSYSQRYKQHLFQNPSYFAYFRNWFLGRG